MKDTTEDDFLGGALTIRQPRDGYRAGADPVFLAAAVPAQAGETVLELGCGVGVAMCCLHHRTSANVTGVERELDLVALAQLNAPTADIFCADLSDLPPSVTERSFDHVMTNPPFFDRAAGSAASGTREAGRGQQTALDVWLDVAIRRMRPKGTFTLVQHMERLPEVLSLLDSRVGAVTVLPLAPRVGRSAHLFLLQARKGARGPFRLLAPFILHEGAAHTCDADSYTQAAKDILRNGASLAME